MTALGPVGIAIVGLSVAFEVVSSNNAEAQRKAEEYTETLDKLTGAATSATDELISMNLAAATMGWWFFARDLEEVAQTVGISLADMIKAVQMTEQEYLQWTIDLGPVMEGSDLQAVIEALDAEREGLYRSREAHDEKTRAMQASNEVAGLYGDAHSRAALAAGRVGVAATNSTPGVKGMGDAAQEAADKQQQLNDTLNIFMGSVSAIGAVDSAKAAIAEIGTSAVENGTKLVGAGKNAETFRSDVSNAFEAAARKAQILGTTAEEQTKIFTGELIQIVAALRASGVKDADIETYLGAMNDLPASVTDIMGLAAQAIGETDFTSSIEKAFNKSVAAGTPMTADAMERLAEGASAKAKEKLGLTMEPQLKSVIESVGLNLMGPAKEAGEGPGRNISAGIASGITAGSPLVQAAVRRVIAEAKVAADAAAKSKSPSRLFAETGDDMMAGVAMGVTRSGKKASEAARRVALMLDRAFKEALAPRSGGPAGDAFSSLFGSREDIRGSARALQDASWALADARDGVVDAEKALTEARKEGNVREVAAAERALARARRDAADAADAAKTVEFVVENKKALLALENIAQKYDHIRNALEQAETAFTQLTQLTATPFGLDSVISEMFGSDTDVRQLANNFAQIEEMIRNAYSALIDPKVVGRSAARSNEREMDANLAQIEEYVAEMIKLRQELDAGLIEEAKLEKELAKITRTFDEANRELERIVAERDGFMKKITDGFRSFVNSLSGLTDGAAREMRESTRDLGNGVRLIMQSADPTSAAGAIASNLKSRLDQVKTFTTNIQSLMKRGLDPALIRDFIESGVSGAGDTVAALAGATDAELKDINSTQTQLLQAAQDFATEAGATYYGPLIAGQQGVVDGLKAQVGAAQAALDAMKKSNEELEAQITGLGESLETMVTELAGTLPARTLQAGQDAVARMIDGFEQKFPEMKSKFGALMDELAASMKRTVTINVKTSGGGRSQATSFNSGSIPLASTSAGRSVTVSPNAVNVTVTGGGTAQGIGEEVRRAVDESLRELAREIVAA